MRIIDVFNGDADGLCALHQLRLAEPARSELVTGLKREVDLLSRVTAGAGASITVLDLSLARNRAALERLLAAGASVRYFDHHHAGAPLAHPRLELHIAVAPSSCTSLLVDRELLGRFALWALVGAYGDNLRTAADRRARTLGLDHRQRDELAELGAAMNYNAYGEFDSDVAIHPRELYLRLRPYADPFAFRAGDPVAGQLVTRLRADLARAAQLLPTFSDARCAVFELPDAPWSRRVHGTLAHHLAAANAARAHAVLKANTDGSYTVSVRAPADSPLGADRLCRRFGGNGRAAAAGIDRLPAACRDLLIDALRRMDWGVDERVRARDTEPVG